MSKANAIISLVCKISLILFAFCAVNACKTSSGERRTQKVIEMWQTMYKPDGSVYYEVPIKIWYDDSIAIEEIRDVNIKDSGGIVRIEYPITGYLLFDIRAKTMTRFSGFSDTSSVINSDTLPFNKIYEGWAFYSSNRKLMDEPSLLNDTIINELKYKQVKFKFSEDNPKVYYIGFLLCNKSDKLFSLEKEYSLSSNCTTVRMDGYFSNSISPFFKQHLVFLKDKLSKQEEKIIIDWKNKAIDFNRKKHP